MRAVNPSEPPGRISSSDRGSGLGVGRHFEHLVARLNQRTYQHAVEALDAYLTVKFDLVRMSDAVCGFRIGPVTLHIEEDLCIVSVNTDRSPPCLFQ